MSQSILIVIPARYASTRLGTLSLHVDFETNEILYGGGFSGEPPVLIENHMNMERAVDTVMHMLLEELKPQPDETLFLLVNRLRLSSYADSYIIANLAVKALEKQHKVAQLRVAPFSNITDKYGFDFSILCMNQETARYMDSYIPSDCFVI